MSPEAGTTPEAPRVTGSPGWRFLGWPFGLLGILVLAVTAAAVTQTIRHHRDIEIARLHAISQLKVQQIADWVFERQGDTRFTHNSPIWAERYWRWRNTGDIAAGELLKQRFEQFGKDKAFASVLLLANSCTPEWDSEGNGQAVDPALCSLAAEAADDREVKRLGPYRDPAGRMRLDFLAPLMEVEARPSPVIVFRVDPERYLLPTLRNWPVPTRSGESLLLKRDGEDVVILSDARGQPDTAARLRLPINSPNLLTGRVFRGEARLGEPIEGIDYRGIEAVGILAPVPGTDWFLVTKMDRAEMMAQGVSNAVRVGLLGLLVLAMTAVGAFSILQRRELAASLHQREAQMEKLRALQLLEAIAGASGMAIFAKDTDGRYLFFNQAAARLTGKTPAQVLARDATVFLPPDEAAAVMARDRRVMEAAAAVTEEEVLTTANGVAILQTTRGALRDAAGQVIGLYGISRDITESKRDEMARRENEERLRVAVEGAGLGLWEWNPGSGELSASDRCRAMFPDSSDAGSNYAAFLRALHPDDRDPTARAFSGALQARSDFSVEYRVPWPDGSMRWIAAMGRGVYAADGTLGRVVGIVMDTTARKQTEIALRESEASFSALFELSPVAQSYVSVSDGFQRTRWNRAWLQQFGYAAEEAQGRSGKDLDLWVNLQQREHYIATALAQGGVRGMEFEMRRCDGAIRLCSLSGSFIRTAGQELLLTSYEDITERRHAEQAVRELNATLEARVAERTQALHQAEAELLRSEKLAALGSLVAGVAHELNTPIGNGVLAASTFESATQDFLHRIAEERLTRGALDDYAETALMASSLMVRNLERAHQLIASFKQVAADQASEQRRSFDLKTAVDDVLATLQPMFKGQPYRLVVDVPAGVELDSFPGPLAQIVTNLVTNSLVHGFENRDEGQMAVRARAYEDRVEIVFEDDGVGIAENVIRRIFEPFFTTRLGKGGSGLGLHIVYNLVTRTLGGRIAAANRPEGGVRFTIDVPLRAPGSPGMPKK